MYRFLQAFAVGLRKLLGMLGSAMPQERCGAARAGPAGGAGGARSARPAPLLPLRSPRGGRGREEGGLRSHLLPTPPPLHIPQRAQLVSRVEGQRLLKLKVQAFSTFFNIQVLQLL